MNITEIKIRKVYVTGPVRALASVTLGGNFAVHDIRVVQGSARLFVAMPSRKNADGGFLDIVHPIGKEARQMLENAVLDAYSAAISEPPC